MPDLKQELQTLADRRSAESTADFDRVLTTARSRRHRRTAAWSSAAAAVVVAVVVLTPWNDTEREPPTTRTPQSPITVTPATARPGATVALTFPDEAGRGIAFQLAKATEPSKVLYYLTSDWGRGTHKPTWWAAGDNGGWVDVGINGPGPDHVVVPDTAEDGTYRLCTANAASQVCGLLTVER
jgi:hypothetical protein